MGLLFLVALGLEHANVAQSAVLLSKIQSIADHELVGALHRCKERTHRHKESASHYVRCAGKESPLLVLYRSDHDTALYRGVCTAAAAVDVVGGTACRYRAAMHAGALPG